MIKSRLLLQTALFAALCSAFLSPLDAAEKPVLLLGKNYGKYERSAWAREILNPLGVAYNNADEWVPPEQWENYSIVVIGLESPEMLGNDEIKIVETYLQNGGTIIVTENAMSTVLSPKAAAWKSWLGAAEVSPEKSAKYENAGDVFPWPAEVKVAGGWGNSFLQLKKCSTAKPIIQSPAGTILAVNSVGKGRVIFFGAAFFRIFQSAGNAQSDYPEKLQKSLDRTSDPIMRSHIEAKLQKLKTATDRAEEQGINDASTLVKGLQGMIAALKPMTDKLSPAQLKPFEQDKLVFWRRDPKVNEATYSYASHALHPEFYPPLPAADEIVSKLSLDVGRDELYHAFVNVFTSVHTGDLNIRASFTTPGADDSKLKIFQQSAIVEPSDKTNITEKEQEEFWLKPVSKWTPELGLTRVFWIQIDSAGMKPGVYAGVLSFTGAGVEKRLPFSVNVWDVSRDRNDKPKMGFWSFNWLDPFPQCMAPFGFANKDLPASSAIPFLTYQYRLGGDTVSGAPDLRRVTLASTGESLSKMIKKKGDMKKNLFNGDGSLAALSFSNFDEQVDIARKIGFDRICIRHGLSTFTQKDNDYIRTLSGEDFLTEKWKRAFVDYWRQFRVYLQSKGFRECSFKFGDELPSEMIEKFWLPVETLAKEAGWLPEINPTGGDVSPELLNKVTPLCRSFCFNANYLDVALKWRDEGKIKIEPGTVMGEYASWGYYKSPSWYTRRVFWQAWAKHQDRIDVFNYAKLMCADANGFYGAASLIGWSQGWNEAGYLTQLQRRAAAAKDEQWKTDATRFLSTVVSEKSPYGLKLAEKQRRNMPVTVEMETNSMALDAARHELLRLLSSAPRE